MKWWVLFLVGCALAGVGTVAIANQPLHETYSFSLPPRYYDYNWVYMLGSGRISGDFAESHGQPVNFYVFDQQEFDAYRSGIAALSLFSIINVPSGSYQVDIQSAGRYYLVVISSIDQTTEQVAQNFTVTQTSLPYLGIESLVGVGTILIIVSFRVRAREIRRLISSIVKAIPNLGPGQGDADDRILATAKDLSRQLALGSQPLVLQWIAWVKLGGIRVAPSDRPLIGVKGKALGTLFMPASLRGRLEPDEWAPLVASALTYGFNPSIRHKRDFLNRLSFLALASAIGIFAIYFSLRIAFPVNDPSEKLALDSLAIISGFLFILLPGRKINMSFRKLLLEADRVTAQIIGKDLMLQTLNKIDSMNLSDVEERKREKQTIWKKAGVLPFPSITQRIQQLEIERSRGRTGD